MANNSNTLCICIIKTHVIDKLQPLCHFPWLQQNFCLFMAQIQHQKMFYPNLCLLLSTSIIQVALDLSMPASPRNLCLIQRTEEHTDSKAAKHFIQKQIEVKDRNTA